MATIGLVLATVLVLLLIVQVRRVLVWIVIALFFAVALYPAVNWVERRVPPRRRAVATLLVFLAAVIVIVGLVALFVTPLVREASQLAGRLPSMIEDARNGRGPVGEILSRFHVLEYLQRNRARITKIGSGLGAPVLHYLGVAATGVVGAVTVFVLSYLMVLEGPIVVEGTLALLPESRARHVRHVGADCAKTVTGYLTGNLLISVICGLLTWIVLLIVGVPFAGLIALFVAVADLIPLIGATLGAVVAVVPAFVHSLTAGIVVLVFFIVYQQAENHLLQPVILSRTVKLNPLTVLISILVAVELAGILGALLAIPIAGVIQVIVRDVWSTRHGGLKPEPTVGADEIPVSEADRLAGSEPTEPSEPARQPDESRLS